MSKKKPPETFEGFGVRMKHTDSPALLRGEVTIAGSRGRLCAPLWGAYGYHTLEPLERIARTPREAWENALRAQDEDIAAKEAALAAALAAARAKRAVMQRELDKVTRDEARKEPKR